MKFNITITEALAEIKTIGKRVATKQTQLNSYLLRDSKLLDPMEKDGGSAEFIKRERQAILDLQKRIVDLRFAIQEANMTTKLSMNSSEKTVFEWLTWRREVAPQLQAHLSRMWELIQGGRQNAQRQGFNVVAAAAAVQGNNDSKELIVNVNELELAKQREEVEQLLGDLDGKLSLINATTTI